MDSASVQRLRDGVNAIPIGSDISSVARQLGPPDWDKTVNKNRFIRFFIYYVTRRRAESAVESDKRVELTFDKSGKLTSVYSNVEGIATRNWP